MSATSSARKGKRDASGTLYDTANGQKKVDPGRVISKINDVDVTVDGDELPEMMLPGMGQKRDDCGDNDVPRFCSECGETHKVGRTCYMVECPRCYKAWARKRATKITAKLEALRRYKESSSPGGWSGFKFHHLVISPPDGYEVEGDALDRTFDVVKEIMDEMGVPTGLLFYHAWRGEDGDDRGFWKHLLPNGQEVDFVDVRENLSHEPHFHAVVLAKHVPTKQVVGDVEDATGWVIKRITKGGDASDNDVSIYNKYDLARAVAYCLSHTAVDMDGDRNRTQYRYFGQVHNFSATPKIEAHMDAAVRSVSPRTLGLQYDDVACSSSTTAPVEDGDNDRRDRAVDVDAAAASASPSTSSTSTDDLDVADQDGDGAAEVETRCNGRLMDIKKAPAFLSDEDWRERADHADQVAEAWEEWRGRVDDDVDPDEVYTSWVDPDDLDGPGDK